MCIRDRYIPSPVLVDLWKYVWQNTGKPKDQLIIETFEYVGEASNEIYYRFERDSQGDEKFNSPNCNCQSRGK